MQSTPSPAASLLFESLAQRLARLTDPRKPRGRRYRLLPLLLLLLIAKLGGADTPQEIAQWIEFRAASLKPLLGLSWPRFPHAATWRRLLQSGLDLSELESLASAYLASLDRQTSRLLNLDGKRLRGCDGDEPGQALTLLALQQSAENLVLRQTALAASENEISAAKRVLKTLDLGGKIVSGDAIFAQRGLSCQVVEGGGDYLWRVKENQGRLYGQVQDFYRHHRQQLTDVTRHYEVEKGHGRLEERRVWASSQYADRIEWPEIGQVLVIEGTTQHLKTGKVSRQVRFAITSLMPLEADAEELLRLMRGHWSIENGLHYRRDVTLKEDRCRMKSRRSGEALAICNNLTIGLLRHAGWKNLAEARRFYCAQPEQALKLLLQPHS